MSINSGKNNNNITGSNQNEKDNDEIYSYSDHRVSTKSYEYEQSEPDHQTSIEKKNKKSLTKKIIAVLCVLTVLVGSVIIVSTYSFPAKDDKPANAEKSESTSSELVISAVMPPEPIQPKKPIYSASGTFKTNLKKLPDNVKKELDKNVTAEFIVLYDATTDEILYQRNADKKCYPASTTKMLTAIVSSAIIEPDTEITVGKEIELIGEDSSTAGLEVGEKMTFEMLMDALMLPSGNDAAYTIAVNAAKIYEENDKLSDKKAVSIFMNLVNDAAEQIGATETHFVTPDGWHDDNHYTSAKDLAKIAAYARTIPLVKNSVKKDYAEWTLKSGETVAWYNSNQLLLNDSGLYSKYVDGMKTGFTDEAGSSVVASATMNGHTLIAVVMNGESLYKKYDDANLLFKAGFKLYNLDYKYGN
ncbi:MAG: D-alanyl-D-alanine carboxypeptidase [Clostridia bacterium]|nr:D-alanyl-D-alanine carboxypeptidase [Clostridia bacterium]